MSGDQLGRRLPWHEVDGRPGQWTVQPFGRIRSIVITWIGPHEGWKPHPVLPYEVEVAVPGGTKLLYFATNGEVNAYLRGLQHGS